MKTPKLGQHFLTNLSVIDKIVEAAELRSSDHVLEVGPGLGILTRALVENAGAVLAVEKDADLHHQLKKRFKDSKNLKLVYGDIRDLNFSELPKNYKVVANIPYYLTGQLIRQMLESENPPVLSVLMLQKEVAERLTAGPGESTILQLTSSVFSEIKKIADVPKEDFSPAPKVDSSIVVFKARPKPLVPATERPAFFRLLKFAFAGKRKKMVNTLSPALGRPKEEILRALKRAGAGENSRPQELSLAMWITLFHDLI